MDTILLGNHQRSRPDLVFLCNTGRLVNGLWRDDEPGFAGLGCLLSLDS